MVWPSAGTPVADVSSWFGGTTLTDAFGHVVLFWIEAMLLYRVLCRYIGGRRALLLVVFGGLLLGALLELIQHWVPARGSTWMDFSANCLGIGLFFWSERWGQQRTHY
jgi:VanZ family protein